MKNITLALASASALLLAPQVTQAQNTTRSEKTQTPGPFQASSNPWQVDSGLLLYQEKDRVTAVKPVVAMSKDYGDERVLNLKFVFDSLTGASPNGAAPANVPQSFTSPSGKTAPKVTPANDTPTIPGFKDGRGALSAGWSQPLSANTKANIGGNFSREYDYTSFGASLGLSQDLNQKNTTLSAGLLLQSDRINPVGGTPMPLEDVSGTQRQANQTKNMNEWVLGLTQVINPKGFYQLSYSRADTRGYMNDPYKMLTLLDGSNQLIPKASSDTYTYLFESRPDKRSRNSIHNRVKYQLTPTVIADVSHRYTSDDWGIKSNTVDTRLRVDLAQKKYYVEPHLRYYKQSKANFYTPYLVQGQLPTYASSDSRLGAFDATTVGVKVGWNLAPGREAGLYLAQYKQNAADVAAPSSGPLAGQTMQAGLSAFVVQLSYRFTWK